MFLNERLRRYTADGGTIADRGVMLWDRKKCYGIVLNQSEARIQDRFHKIFSVRVRVSFRVGLGF